MNAPVLGKIDKRRLQRGDRLIGTVTAAKSGAACGVQLLKETSHRVVESQGTLRFILPDNKFAGNPNCLGLAGSTLLFMAHIGRDWPL